MAKSTIQVFRKSIKKKREHLINQINTLGYREIQVDEKIEFLFEKGVKNPKRANFENLKQEQFVYESETGYKVFIHTGMIEDKFSERGSAWIIIIDKKKEFLKKRKPDSKSEKVFIREFYRMMAGGHLDKLLAYACFCKKIADKRPANADLEFVKNIQTGNISEIDMCWNFKSETKPFDLNFYTIGLRSFDQKIILSTERKRNAYLKKTEGKVRRERSFRSKWKK